MKEKTIRSPWREAKGDLLYSHPSRGCKRYYSQLMQFKIGDQNELALAELA